MCASYTQLSDAENNDNNKSGITNSNSNSNSNSNNNNNTNSNSNTATNSNGIPLARIAARRQARHGRSDPNSPHPSSSFGVPMQARYRRGGTHLNISSDRRTGFFSGASGGGRVNVAASHNNDDNTSVTSSHHSLNFGSHAARDAGGESNNGNNNEVSLELLQLQVEAEVIAKFGFPYVELSSKYHSYDDTQNPKKYWYQVASMKYELDAFYAGASKQFELYERIGDDKTVCSRLDKESIDGLARVQKKLHEIKDTYDNLKALWKDLVNKLSESYPFVKVSLDLLKRIQQWEQGEGGEDTEELLNLNAPDWDNNPLTMKYPFENCSTMKGMCFFCFLVCVFGLQQCV